jgi:hypothetical protein
MKPRAMQANKPLVKPDPRQPYLVYARDPHGAICVIGRSTRRDGGRLAEIIAKDGFEVTKVVEVRR